MSFTADFLSLDDFGTYDLGLFDSDFLAVFFLNKSEPDHLFDASVDRLIANKVANICFSGTFASVAEDITIDKLIDLSPKNKRGKYVPFDVLTSVHDDFSNEEFREFIEIQIKHRGLQPRILVLFDEQSEQIAFLKAE